LTLLISVFLNKEPSVQTSPYVVAFWKKREMVKETEEEKENHRSTVFSL
jgi:hypothetical protein